MKLENLRFDIFGGVMTSSDPLNLIVRGIYLNKTIASFGFNFPITCNYPNASIIGEILIENSQIIMSEVTPKQITNVITH